MTDHEPSMPVVENQKKRGISPVWTVPVIALVVGGLVAWQSLTSRGPLVRINFETGHGITAGKTLIKHKDFVVGVVEEVMLNEDLSSVIVMARMNKETAPYLGDTATFSVVTARVAGTNISGLGTLLSGAYIKFDWNGKPDKRASEFQGQDTPPLTPPGAVGSHVTLRSRDAGSIGVGSNILYRNIVVGQVESRRLAEDFASVEYQAFIEAPYDTLVNDESVFWDVSGLSLEAGANGVKFRVASVETLMSGGVTFGNFGSNLATSSVSPDTTFSIYSSEEDARESQYAGFDDEGFMFMVHFESPQGLEVGAPVEWEGIRIGTVRDVSVDIRAAGSDDAVTAYLVLQPKRLGLEQDTPEVVRTGMDQWIQEGMRAQLATGNIFAGKRLVAFVNTDDVGVAGLDLSSSPYPTIPSSPSEFSQVAQSVEQIVSNLASLPFDQLVGSAIDLLDDTGKLIASPEMNRLPGSLNDTLASFSGVAVTVQNASETLPDLVRNMNELALAGDVALAGLSPSSEIYMDLSGAVRDLRETARSLSALARRLEQNPNALITGK